MFKLLKSMQNVYFNYVTGLSLFNTYVHIGSVLKNGDYVERIHLEYLKILLKVSKYYSSLMIYNELGRL